MSRRDVYSSLGSSSDVLHVSSYQLTLLGHRRGASRDLDALNERVGLPQTITAILRILKRTILLLLQPVLSYILPYTY